MTIGETLKEKRLKNELTQEQLSEKIFVSRKTISNWETGKTTPDIDSLIRLANLFNLSLDHLLLEGSDIVENIKKQAEIRSTRIYQVCSFITNLAFLFILGTQPVFGKLSFPALMILVVSTMSNGIVLLYFSNKLFSLHGYRKLSDMPQKERYKSILLGALFGIVSLSIIIYLRFYY